MSFLFSFTLIIFKFLFYLFSFGLPSEFQVPSEHMDHMNDGTHNFENNNFIGNYSVLELVLRHFKTFLTML